MQMQWNVNYNNGFSILSIISMHNFLFFYLWYAHCVAQLDRIVLLCVLFVSEYFKNNEYPLE